MGTWKERARKYYVVGRLRGEHVKYKSGEAAKKGAYHAGRAYGATKYYGGKAYKFGSDAYMAWMRSQKPKRKARRTKSRTRSTKSKSRSARRR